MDVAVLKLKVHHTVTSVDITLEFDEETSSTMSLLTPVQNL